MERYVEHAIQAGLTELGFSDHLFMYWLPSERRDPSLGMAEWEHDFYIEDVERCRRRYAAISAFAWRRKPTSFPATSKSSSASCARYDWDYVIGSVHFMGEWGFDDCTLPGGIDRCDVDALYRAVLRPGGRFGRDRSVRHDRPQPTWSRSSATGRRSTRAKRTRDLAARLARAGVCVEVNTARLAKAGRRDVSASRSAARLPCGGGAGDVRLGRARARPKSPPTCPRRRA